MKNKHLLLFTIIGIVLIIYGIFSRYIALDTIYQLDKEETDLTPAYEVITVSGNKIEYYNI